MGNSQMTISYRCLLPNVYKKIRILKYWQEPLQALVVNDNFTKFYVTLFSLIYQTSRCQCIFETEIARDFRICILTYSVFFFLVIVKKSQKSTKICVFQVKQGGCMRHPVLACAIRNVVVMVIVIRRCSRRKGAV